MEEAMVLNSRCLKRRSTWPTNELSDYDKKPPSFGQGLKFLKDTGPSQGLTVVRNLLVLARVLKKPGEDTCLDIRGLIFLFRIWRL